MQVEKICEWCKSIYIVNTLQDVNKRRFCSCSCAAKWRMSFPERRKTSRKYGKLMSENNIGKKRPDASKRMKENNPMKNPENIEKMRQKKIGCTFLSRGGNPKKTLPQIKLAEALNLIDNMEYVINTSSVKDKFKSLPNCYKVDIAILEYKIAIEVDGDTHKLKKWKYIDKRKTLVLESLGWKVIRFTNEEILNDLAKVLNIINEILKKYKEIKT